jgi:hypothetical protein
MHQDYDNGYYHDDNNVHVGATTLFGSQECKLIDRQYHHLDNFFVVKLCLT